MKDAFFIALILITLFILQVHFVIVFILIIVLIIIACYLLSTDLSSYRWSVYTSETTFDLDFCRSAARFPGIIIVEFGSRVFIFIFFRDIKFRFIFETAEIGIHIKLGREIIRHFQINSGIGLEKSESSLIVLSIKRVNLAAELHIHFGIATDAGN